LVNFNLNILQSCSSTNDIAIKNAREGLPEGTSYLSYSQTKGRGRNNNRWNSIKGNLFLSTIFRPTCKKIYWHQLSLIIGHSIIETLVNLGVRKNTIELKWPNDVLVMKKKISGVLLESFDNFIVGGIGLNIVKVPENEIKWKTTKLNDHLINDFTLKYIANMLLKTIFKNYVIWEAKGFIFFKNKLNNNLKNINNNIVIRLNSDLNNISGIFLGLGDNGSLKIKVGNEIFEYYSVESLFLPDVGL
jgi:BirA family biotin operon repressor/biotin-[acetyl-CoA-carboxylase] ligase